MRDTDCYQVGWIGTTALMLKTQIGLGVLSMPAVFDVLGVVPGVILLCVIGGITSWSDWMVGVFKLKHRHVYGIDDVGEMLFGRIGREFFSVAFCLCKSSLQDWKFVDSANNIKSSSLSLALP